MLIPVYNTTPNQLVETGDLETKELRRKNRREKIRKGGHLRRFRTKSFSWRSSELRIKRSAFKQTARTFRSLSNSRTACSYATGEAALILARLYMSPPASPGWDG